MTPAGRVRELLVHRNHAYLLADMRRHGIPLTLHAGVANLIHEYTNTKENNT